MNRAIRFKFGTDIKEVPLLRVDHKTPLSGTWEVVQKLTSPT